MCIDGGGGGGGGGGIAESLPGFCAFRNGGGGGGGGILGPPLDVGSALKNGGGGGGGGIIGPPLDFASALTKGGGGGGEGIRESSGCAAASTNAGGMTDLVDLSSDRTRGEGRMFEPVRCAWPFVEGSSVGGKEGSTHSTAKSTSLETNSGDSGSRPLFDPDADGPRTGDTSGVSVCGRGTGEADVEADGTDGKMGPEWPSDDRLYVVSCVRMDPRVADGGGDMGRPGPAAEELRIVSIVPVNDTVGGSAGRVVLDVTLTGAGSTVSSVFFGLAESRGGLLLLLLLSGCRSGSPWSAVFASPDGVVEIFSCSVLDVAARIICGGISATMPIPLLPANTPLCGRLA